MMNVRIDRFNLCKFAKLGFLLSEEAWNCIINNHDNINGLVYEYFPVHFH